MSEQTAFTAEVAATPATAIAPQGKLMNRDDLLALEHKIQTGEIDTLPSGVKVKDQFAANLKLQEQQEAARVAAIKKPYTREAQVLNPVVEVRQAPNGAIMSSLAPAETTADPDAPPNGQQQQGQQAPPQQQNAAIGAGETGHEAGAKEEEEDS